MAAIEPSAPDIRKRRRIAMRSAAIAVTASVAALGLVSAPTVQAQSAGSGTVDPESVDPSVAPGSLFGAPSLSLAGLTQIGAPIPLTAVLGSLGAVGSADFARPGSTGTMSGKPLAVRDDAITASTVLSVEPMFPNSTNEADRRAEVWTVTSESMQRKVRVEVYRAPAGVDAPNMYFLDGVGSETPSGWSGGMGWGDPQIRERKVNVIAPTGAPSSMWSDWEKDDPTLGPNKWETFLVEELPPLLKAGLEDRSEPLAHNGSWGVLGVSMGAASALHLANRYDMFGGAAGVSGAYTTTDDLGYQYARLTVSARGGEVTNMWGPRNSDSWIEHDTVADPSGLEGKAVYLSAATGRVGSSELGRFGSDTMILLDGHILEKGSYESTRALQGALATVPGVDLKTNYMPTGIHNWPIFVTEMLPGTDHVLSGLKPPVSNFRTTTGAVGDRSEGSTGSSSSSNSLASSGSTGSTGSAGSTGSLGSSGN